MITGKNRRVISNISDHIVNDRGYDVIKCPPGRDALMLDVPLEMPQVIIICLFDETKDTVKVYNVLRECSVTDWISIIVIAGEDDTALFKKYTELKRMSFLSRPVSLVTLYSKLMDIEQKLESGRENGMSGVAEYVNPNATDKRGVKRKRILIVDDDPDQLIQLKSILTEFYDVTAVRSGKDAFRYLEKHEIDLMLLDYLMPEMDGPEVLNRIRESVDYAWIPVIFLTGMTEKDKVIKTLVELKPQGYLVKPARKSEIVAKIIDVLG